MANIPIFCRLSRKVQAFTGLLTLLVCYFIFPAIFCLSSQRAEKRNLSQIEDILFKWGNCNRKFTLESSVGSKMKPLFQIQRGQMSYYAKKPQIKYGELVGVDSSLSQSFYSFLQKYIFWDGCSLNIAIICKTGWKCLPYRSLNRKTRVIYSCICIYF